MNHISPPGLSVMVMSGVSPPSITISSPSVPLRVSASSSSVAVLDDAAFGGATPVEPKRVSPVDPAARYTQVHGNRAHFASRRERKKVKMLFAHLKRIMRLERLRLRGHQWCPG